MDFSKKSEEEETVITVLQRCQPFINTILILALSNNIEKECLV